MKEKRAMTDHLAPWLPDWITPYTVRYDLAQLVQDYNKYGHIIVAYDFDGTVHPDYKDQQDVCGKVCGLLKQCSRYTNDIDMICYTCRGDESEIQNEVIPFLMEHGIRHDKINDNSNNISEDRLRTLSCKLLFNIFLDNRAGLIHTYEVLSNFVAWLRVKRGEIPDIFGFTEIGLLDLK